MDEDNPAESFQDEASCSLCLGFFQDPVSIHCGHNFCRACITRCWEEEEQTFPCPRCKATAAQPNLRPNRELAKIIEIAKRLSLRAPGAGERLCERHREALKLFCEEDQAPICLVCRESQAHRLHAAVPIEEAVEEQKEKIQAHVQILKEKKEKLQGLKEAEEGKSLEFLEKVQQERQKVALDVKELQRFVEQQERLLLGRLEKLDQEIVRRKEENLAKILEEISSVSEQIRELEEKCQQPPCEFLQETLCIPSRLENEKSQKVTEILPAAGGNSASPAPKNTSLKETLMQFRESLTLDPDTAHPRLLLSEDQKCVRWEEARHPAPDNPKRFDSSRCVLGCRGFNAGRHYWEVEVGDGEAWAVGVAKESVGRKGRISVKPEAGIWAVGQCGAQYQALTSPASPIALLSAPRVIGIYLDYEAGRVAFFDANNEVPIFAYPPSSFGGERLLPLLCLGRGCRFTLGP
ncbi:E3 ubiquitin-protein ligase TRIM39-like isoform X2 [Tympanuchus pallidicinctus]|uniref:E3 ubiquitin-protein ligase TRIM39-like isoform X2 n=1 Tax=Tympanuchus pallidicinctus TaxID=109042 RepID=UPI0022872727|nr:E3 ubiquitin-protein ligase TRIM39-like isoform X2 [Tympanuchus pallidicinctus]